jgi:hypothetical protein
MLKINDSFFLLFFSLLLSHQIKNEIVVKQLTNPNALIFTRLIVSTPLHQHRLHPYLLPHHNNNAEFTSASLKKEKWVLLVNVVCSDVFCDKFYP